MVKIKELVDRGIKGIIFDCDGVLVDSEPLSCYALNVLFDKYFDVDIGNDYTPVIGKVVRDGILYYINIHNITNVSDDIIDKMVSEKDGIYMELAKEKLKSFTGNEKFIKTCLEMNLKVGVASSGTLKKIIFNLSISGLLQYFSSITSSDEVTKGKPDPEIFILSAKKLGLRPDQCLVIEDSVSGIQAANAANMISVGVTNTFSKEELLKANPNIVVQALGELIQ